MFTVLYSRKAQSTAEYAIVIGLVIAAVLGMQTYVKRGLQGRSHDATQAFSQAVTNTSQWNAIGGKANVTGLDQYEYDKIKSRMSQQVTDEKQTSDLKTGGMVERTYTQGVKQAEGDYQQVDYDK